MDVGEKFIGSLVQKDRKHVVFADGAIWYPQACNVFRLKHYGHSPFKKSLVQRVNQYFKDRIESFDDCYPRIQMNVTYLI